jgi:hypothetical protein
MISPEEIKQQTLKWWTLVLQSHIRGENCFPRTIDRIGKIRSGDVRQQFEKVQSEVETLLRYSKNETGTGYTVEKSGYNFRRSGSHELPERIIVETLEDYLHITGKKKEWNAFIQNLDLVVAAIPALKHWALSNTNWVIKGNIDWSNIILVCKYFLSKPRPDLYIRQLPIPVHTKFIEENAFLLQSLLDFLIPEHIRDPKLKKISERYFLRYDEPLIRIRILDKALSFQYNIQDMSIPISSFRSLNLDCFRILITENKMNFLALPDVPYAIAIWSGGGFNVSYLKGIDWLANRQIYYWGDIDEHGFLILHQLRSYYSKVKSIMMDVETFKKFDLFAVTTKAATAGDLSLLNEPEQNLLRLLKSSPLKNRLEQERISQEYVMNYFKIHVIDSDTMS